MSLVKHAEVELEGALKSEDPYTRSVAFDALALVRVFAVQGHSGTSASIVRDIFHKLSAFKPLGPLTGEPGEWNEVSADGLLQNRRCSHVFKAAEGAYTIEGVVYEDPSGARYTNASCWRPVSFPYTVPESPPVVRVDKDGVPIALS